MVDEISSYRHAHDLTIDLSGRTHEDGKSKNSLPVTLIVRVSYIKIEEILWL